MKCILFLAAALFLGSASAVKLPVKTIEVMPDGKVIEILDQVATGMRRSGGGEIVRRTITKVPGKIPWGGVITWGPVIINTALQYLYQEAKNSMSSPLINWYEEGGDGWLQPKNFYYNTPSMQRDPYLEMVGGCKIMLSDGTRLTLHRQRINTDYPEKPTWVIISTGVNSVGDAYVGVFGYDGSAAAYDAACRQFAPGKTLDEVIQQYPDVAGEVANAIRRFANEHPDHPAWKGSFSSPTPTINQWDLDLIDPTVISVPGSRYPDGDYLQEGLEPLPGNVKHPADGGPVEPWPGVIVVDIDDDGIPDYRDGDDDNDGITDEDEKKMGTNQKDPASGDKDTDGDGIPDKQDSDDDNDGFSDEFEQREGTDPKDPNSKPLDTDKDGLIDRLDDDDDNDGWDDITEEIEKSDPKNPNSRPVDTDGDGRGDVSDSDDDNDGYTDKQEEDNNTDPKDPKSTPPDNDKDGKPDPQDPDDDNDGVPDDEDPDPKDPEKKPIECGIGSSPSADGKSCVPDEDPEKCPPGTSKGEDGKCEEKKDDSPVPDDCGVFTVQRFLTHMGHFMRDVVFPCESPDDLFKPVHDVIETKFPFSLITALNKGVLTDVRSGGNPASIPTDWGYFKVDMSKYSAIWAISKLLFKTALGVAFFAFLIGKLVGQVVIK